MSADAPAETPASTHTARAEAAATDQVAVTFTRTHDVASFVQNEERPDRAADNTAPPSRDENLEQRLKRIFGSRAPTAQRFKQLVAAAIISLVIIVFVLIIIGVTVAATHAKGTVKEYKMPVMDRGDPFFERVNIFGNIAMFWTPNHNDIVRCTTIHDFAMGWSGFHDEDHNICFLRRLNFEDFPSIELLEKAVTEKRKIPNFTPIKFYNWISTPVNGNSLHQLSPMLQWKCTGQQRRTFYMTESETALSFNRTDSCQRVCLPHYGLRATGPDNTLHFDMPYVDCVYHPVC